MLELYIDCLKAQEQVDAYTANTKKLSTMPHPLMRVHSDHRTLRCRCGAAIDASVVEAVKGLAGHLAHAPGPWLAAGIAAPPPALAPPAPAGFLHLYW